MVDFTKLKRQKERLVTKVANKIDPSGASFGQQKKRGGLLVTSELDNALQECGFRVATIAKECRAKNRKFRDIEFDLENDGGCCLHGLATPDDEKYSPSDVQRVTQIFDKPQFFVDGADSNDIVQGQLGDCWFLSALATMSTAKGLVERFCVARDEQVGVYGFIFFRDTSWVVVVIDDMLYTSIPKFEELSYGEKHLYHNDKEHYNLNARKGGKGLYFAKSGTPGETWVALIEKAYAKLHGDYASLDGGEACEAIEDLTGGVSSFLPTKDILDPDKFWNEELLFANQDRLFGCSSGGLDSSRSGDTSATINGLIGGHAYSVLRAVEHKGKRFVVIRNPWGQSEWTGPWSDGSKEWSPEWLSALPELGHTFGDDGQFIMEYKDFLANWEYIDRTLLFDQSWVMSSQWLEVTARPLPSAWTYGDVSFTISLPAPSFTIIVLSKLDDRYFKGISGRSMWTFDFVLFKKGEQEALGSSAHSRFFSRSVNLEANLEAGDYVVHVRLDRVLVHPADYYEEGAKEWNERKLSRVLTERAKSQTIVSNFNMAAEAGNLPVPLESFAGQDLAELNTLAGEPADAVDPTDTLATTTTTTSATVSIKTKTTSKRKASKPPPGPIKDDDGDEAYEEDDDEDKDEDAKTDDEDGDYQPSEDGPPPKPDTLGEDSVFLGLRVYTKSDSAAVVGGQLKQEMSSFEGQPSPGIVI